MSPQEYAPGRAVDLYGDPAGPTVLLWHGMQSNARASVRRLAEALATHGLDVVVPDWDSHAVDRGRSDLLGSAVFARSRRAPIVLVGWSMGGLAAADSTLHARDLELPICHTVCLAGAFAGRGPISGTPIEVPDTRAAVPFTLLHGVADQLVPVSVSRDFATRLTDAGWPVDLAELDTDHGAIAGARYDASADRYDAAEDARTLGVAADVAARIAATVP